MRSGSRPAAHAHLPHLDNLRTALVAWVIGGHALLGYSAVGGWAYAEIHEVAFLPAVELALVAVLGPSGLFVIGLFFFVAGLTTERSLARRGPGGYLLARARQLGLPWLLSVLVLWPVSLWLAYRVAGRSVTPAWVMLHRATPLDSGALWFALVLLVYSAGVAGWRVVAGPPPDVVRPFTAAGLAGAVLVIATTSFVVRLGFPARSGQPGDLHLWQWPQCLGMFLLGIAAARRGWAREVPPALRRGCGIVAVATVVGLPILALSLGLDDVAHQQAPYLGGWHWEALATAVVEALLVVCGTVFLVGSAERRLPAAGPRAARWARAAFPAFVVQGPILLALACALRFVPAPAEVKAPVVAAAGIATCFWLGARLPVDRWLGRSRTTAPAPEQGPAPGRWTSAGQDGKRSQGVQCIGCGEELLAERVELGYRYCLKAACQEQFRRGPEVTAVGVNKSGESFVVAEPDEVRRRAEAGELAPKNVAIPTTPTGSTAPARRPRPGPTRSATPARPWTRQQEDLVRLYHDMGLSPRQIVDRARQAAPRLRVDERLVVKILSSPKR